MVQMKEFEEVTSTFIMAPERMEQLRKTPIMAYTEILERVVFRLLLYVKVMN